ncbi:MAG: sulfatase [Gemmataceae bacterium]
MITNRSNLWLSITLIIVSLSVLAVPSSVLAEEQTSKRPNIIFFLSDDQRFDVMGCAGHPIVKTPTMDKLAKNGVRFRNAFVTTSICAASRASIFTSLYERTHQYTFGEAPVRPQHVAISYPTLLRLAGYRTGFIGKFGVSANREGMFDSFVSLSRGPYIRKDKKGRLRHISEQAGDHAIQFLNSSKEGQPFCLSISFNAPHAEDRDKKNHYPWPKAVDGLYKKVEIPAPKLSAPKIFQSQPKFLQESMNRDRYFWRWDTPEKYDRNVRAYFRMISGIDRVMGRVINELERLKVAENTIIIFCGDNGYYLANRGFAGKWSHYEDSLRIPMIIYDPRLPESKRGRVVEPMALNIDIPATIIDVAGVKQPKLYQGRSLMPLMLGKKQTNWREEFFCEHLMRHPDIPKWEGVRGRRWVYARYFDQNPPFEFLHDLKNDPDQLKNLANNPTYAKTLAEMRQRMEKLRDTYGGPYNPRPRPKRKKRSPAQFRMIKIPAREHGYSNFQSQVIDSQKEFTQFVKNVKNQKHWNRKPDFLKALQGTKINFKNQSVVLVRHTESSGSIQVRFTKPKLTDGKLQCVIARKVPEVGTDDLAFYCFAIVVDKRRVREVFVWSGKRDGKPRQMIRITAK